MCVYLRTNCVYILCDYMSVHVRDERSVQDDIRKCVCWSVEACNTKINVKNFDNEKQ